MKNSLLVSGKYYKFLKRRRELYECEMDQQESNYYLDLIENEEEFKECQRILNANKRRKYNNWHEICKWLFGINQIPLYKDCKLIFGTLTFENKVLNNTSEETRRRYVTRYLSKKAIHYSANVDFGKLNEREHYHFIAMVEKRLNHKDWKLGFSDFQEIKLHNIRKVVKYLLKLNNHSYKDSTRQKRIIRDRNIDWLEYATEKLYVEEFHRFKSDINAIL